MSRPDARSRTRACLQVEQLETRLAPAALFSATSVTYQDVDGDNVTVTLSKPLLNAGNVANVFVFNIPFGSGGGQQLQRIDLTPLGAAAANGTGVTVTAVRSPINGGDGFANVGQINAANIDLGAVSVRGDLGQIDAGDLNPVTTGLLSLTVQSMGRFGISTQAAGGNLDSSITGKLGTLTVKSDIVGAFISVTGGPSPTDGQIGSVKIGGSLIGLGAANSGSLTATGKIGPLSVTGDVVGGAGLESGRIRSLSGSIASVTIGGSLIGDPTANSARNGTIQSAGDMGLVSIKGDIRGGFGQDSGQVSSGAKLAGLTVGGSLIGASSSVGGANGNVTAFNDIGPVTVTGSLLGGAGNISASVTSFFGSITSVTVGGSLVGSASFGTGRIIARTNLGPVKIAGDVRGGAGQESGSIRAIDGKIASVSVGGSLIGDRVSVAAANGFIQSGGDMGLVSIKGDLVGGAADLAGSVRGNGKLAGASVGGSLVGGTGAVTGAIRSSFLMGPVSVARDVRAGSGPNSGQIQASGITSVSIGGSLVGGSSIGGNIVGGDLGAIKITGDLLGGAGSGAGQVFATGKIASVTIGGSIRSGAGAKSGSIIAGNSLGPVIVTGSLVGTAAQPVVITARGQAVVPVNATTDVAITSVLVKGRAEFANVIAGLDFFGNAQNADAQIGAVTVSGDWIASNVAAGAVAGADLKFGTADDLKMSGAGVKDDPLIASRITSLFINGQALGTVAGTDNFGIVAELIAALKIGGITSLPILAGAKNDIAGFLVGATADLRAREV